MRLFAAILATPILIAAVPATAQEQDGAEEVHHAVQPPSAIQWQAGPPSIPAGAEFTVLEGDPSQEGYFALRLRLPDGYVIPPHWHPVQERVTVLSGTLYLGEGEVADRQQAQQLPPGSYFSLAPRMAHYAIAEGETVIQLTSLGPREINYIDPADDPRR